MRRPAAALPALVLLAAVLLPAPAPAQDQEAGARLMEHALQLLQQGDEAGALEELELLISRFPDSELVDNALLQMLGVRARNDELEPARELARRLESQRPDSPAVAAATVLVTDLRLRAGSADAAELTGFRDELQRLLLLWPRNAPSPVDWEPGVHVVAGEISLELGELETARGWFAGILDGDSSPAWHARGLVGLARCFLRDDEWQVALRLLQEATETPAVQRPPFPDPRQAAADLTALVYRHRVRPAVQAQRWQETRRISRAGQPFDDPIGVAVSSGGQILITDEGESRVSLLAWDGTLVASQTMGAESHPWFDRQGGPWITTGVSAVDPIGRSRSSFQEGGREPRSIEKIVAGARNSAGEWILVHDDGERVSRFDPAGVRQTTLYTPRDGDVVDIALDSRGRVLVLNEDANVVVRIAADGTTETIARGSWDRPVAIAVDGLDNIYVLDRDRRHVHVLDPAGTRVEIVGPNLPGGGPSLSDPRDIAVAPGGELLVIDRDLAALIVLQ